MGCRPALTLNSPAPCSALPEAVVPQSRALPWSPTVGCTQRARVFADHGAREGSDRHNSENYELDSMQRLAILCLIVFVPLQAQAYVDPGSGMLIWQGLVALLGAAILFVRRPLRALKRWYRRLLGK